MNALLPKVVTKIVRLFFLLLVAVLAFVGTMSAPALAQTTSTWIGGAGNWAPCPKDGGNALWDTCSGDVYPAGNYNAVIQGGPVTLASGNGISIVNFSVASGDSVIVTPGYLFITGTTIQNNGTISVGPGNGFDLDGTQTATLSGSGTVTMTDPNAHFWGLDGPSTLINQQTIQGQGAFSLGMNLTNQGTINANAGTLSMQPTSAINTGIMEASSGSTLAFTNGTPAPYNNTGGFIKALDGGTVQLDNGVYTGGTLTTTGTGVIQANNSAVLNGLTNSGTLQISAANLENTITNTGTIQVPSGTLNMSGNVTLTGSGSVIMSGSSNLRQLDGTDTLTNQQLIHGSGTIFELPLTNHGTIAADSKSNTLFLAGGTTTNNSTIEASAGGILQIDNDNTVNNTGGTVEALAGSTVILSGTLNGGTLNTSGTGTIKSKNGTLDGTANVPTNAGKLTVPSPYSLNLQGTINNTGTITMSGNGCLILLKPTTLTGAGKVMMGASNCIYGGGTPLTNQSTIQGAGSIGDSNPMGITNNGTIMANKTSPLTIVPDSTGFTNTGKLIVNNGSSLIINSIGGPFNNLSGGTLTGGTYDVTGTLEIANSITTNAASITLTGAAAQIFNTSTSSNALGGLVANAATGALSLQSGQVLTTTTNCSNAGKATVGASSGFKLGGSYTQTAGTTTVDGTLTAPTGLNLQKGTLLGKGTLAAAVTSTGTMTVGDSTTKPGVLTVTGSYTQNAGGVLDVAIGGKTLGSQYSQLAVSNGVSLGGTLTIKRINGFTPNVGDTFTILTGSVVTGQFTRVNGTSINSNEHFQVNYTSKAVTLAAASGP